MITVFKAESYIQHIFPLSFHYANCLHSSLLGTVLETSPYLAGGPDKACLPAPRAQLEPQPIHRTDCSHGEMPQHFEMEPRQVTKLKTKIKFKKSPTFISLTHRLAA